MMAGWARRLIILFVTVVLAVIIYIPIELKYRSRALESFRSHPNINNMLFYSESLSRKPNRFISFRFYTSAARIAYSADFRLNNMGFFSNRDYSFDNDEGRYRIVVLGQEQTASSVVDRSWPDFLEELLNSADDLKSSKGRFEVFNLAWPDGGFREMRDSWEEYGRRFKPDLVILNLNETDFFRGIASKDGVPEYHARFRGRALHGHPIEFDIDGDLVELYVSAAGPISSLRDSMAVPSRPYGILTKKEFMDNQEKVEKLQNQIVSDFLAGVPLGFAPRFLMKLLAIDEGIDPHLIRNFDAIPSRPLDKDAAIRNAEEHLLAIAGDCPKLLLIHNANRPEVITGSKYELSDALMSRNEHLNIVDMRKYLPRSEADEEVDEWYLMPHMPEKWSLQGHKVYARSVATLVKEVILGEREQLLSKAPHCGK